MLRCEIERLKELRSAQILSIRCSSSGKDRLEEMLENESDPASGRSIEIKAGMKKIMTQPEVIQSLDRLEVQGQPVWGLSVQERELIQLARELVNAC